MAREDPLRVHVLSDSPAYLDWAELVGRVVTERDEALARLDALEKVAEAYRVALGLLHDAAVYGRFCDHAGIGKLGCSTCDPRITQALKALAQANEVAAESGEDRE